MTDSWKRLAKVIGIHYNRSKQRILLFYSIIVGEMSNWREK